MRKVIRIKMRPLKLNPYSHFPQFKIRKTPRDINRALRSNLLFTKQTTLFGTPNDRKNPPVFHRKNFYCGRTSARHPRSRSRNTRIPEKIRKARFPTFSGALLLAEKAVGVIGSPGKIDLQPEFPESCRT